MVCCDLFRILDGYGVMLEVSASDGAMMVKVMMSSNLCVSRLFADSFGSPFLTTFGSSINLD